MGNTSTINKNLDSIPCACCSKPITPKDSKYRKCGYLGCSYVYCKLCMDDFMFQRDANTFLCGEHHFEAEEFPATDRQPISSRASATKRMPPTPSMTPGTQQLLNLVATKPRVEEPSTQNHKRKKVDKSRNSLKLIDEMHEVSPRTQAAAEVAAKYAVMSLNNFSIGTTASINSVDLLNKMLETRSDANLMINGNLDVGGEATGPRPRYWTEEEDDMLQKAVEQYGAKNWKTIAAFVPGRTHVQCLQRWNKVLKPGLRKGIWTEDENNILLEFVREMEPNVDWAEISNRIPGRSAKQCRERWTFNLDPNINKNDWTEKEDEILSQEQNVLGNKWSQISEKLPGRTENAIKTRFKSIVRAKKREWRPSEDALLLKYQEEMGSKWAEIAELIPNRTKNAIKTRYKFLTGDSKDSESAVEVKKPTQNKYTVRAGASQSAKAHAQTDEARLRARTAALAATAAAEALATSSSQLPDNSVNTGYDMNAYPDMLWSSGKTQSFDEPYKHEWLPEQDQFSSEQFNENYYSLGMKPTANAFEDLNLYDSDDSN